MSDSPSPPSVSAIEVEFASGSTTLSSASEITAATPSEPSGTPLNLQLSTESARNEQENESRNKDDNAIRLCADVWLQYSSFLGHRSLFEEAHVTNSQASGTGIVTGTWFDQHMEQNFLQTTSWLNSPITSRFESSAAVVECISQLSQRGRVLAADALPEGSQIPGCTATLTDPIKQKQLCCVETWLLMAGNASSMTPNQAPAAPSFRLIHMASTLTFDVSSRPVRWLRNEQQEISSWQYNRLIGQSLTFPSGSSVWLSLLQPVKPGNARLLADWCGVYGRQSSATARQWFTQTHAPEFAEVATYANAASTPYFSCDHANALASFDAALKRGSWVACFIVLGGRQLQSGEEVVTWIMMELLRSDVNGGPSMEHHFLMRTTFSPDGRFLAQSKDEMTADEARRIAQLATMHLHPSQAAVQQLAPPVIPQPLQPVPTATASAAAPYRPADPFSSVMNSANQFFGQFTSVLSTPTTQPVPASTLSHPQPVLQPPPSYSSAPASANAPLPVAHAPAAAGPAAAAVPVTTLAVAATNPAVGRRIDPYSNLRNKMFDARTPQCADCHQPPGNSVCWSCNRPVCDSCISRRGGMLHCYSCPAPWTNWSTPFDDSPESKSAALDASKRGGSLLPDHRELSLPEQQRTSTGGWVYTIGLLLQIGMFISAIVTLFTGAIAHNSSVGCGDDPTCCSKYHMCFDGNTCSLGCDSIGQDRCSMPESTSGKIGSALSAVAFFSIIVTGMSFTDRLQLYKQMSLLYRTGFYSHRSWVELVKDFVKCTFYAVINYRRDLSAISFPSGFQHGDCCAKRMVTLRYTQLLFNPAFVIACVVFLALLNPKQDSCYSQATGGTNTAPVIIVLLVWALVPKLYGLLSMWHSAYSRFNCWNWQCNQCCILCPGGTPYVDNLPLLPGKALGLLAPNLLVGEVGSQRESFHFKRVVEEGWMRDRIRAHVAFHTGETKSGCFDCFKSSDAAASAPKVAAIESNNKEDSMVLPAGHIASDSIQLESISNNKATSSKITRQQGKVVRGWQVTWVSTDSISSDMKDDNAPPLPLMEIVTRVNGKESKSGEEVIDWEPHFSGAANQEIKLRFKSIITGRSREVSLKRQANAICTPQSQLGLSVRFLSSPVNDIFPSVLWIKSVQAGSPAFAAGLRQWHIILAIANTPSQIAQPINAEVLQTALDQCAKSRSMLLLVVLHRPRRFLLQVAVRPDSSSNSSGSLLGMVVESKPMSPDELVVYDRGEVDDADMQPAKAKEKQ